ncbi:hypothetical protein [Hymenobacter koreensis]|uniref:DUF1772 domain-containing protein n=1 Tax=Hymenobacter koreensis TaxID=1084523 RepID=A0ABP8JNF8_9BACT
MNALLIAYAPALAYFAAVFLYAGVAAGSNEYQIARGYDVSHLWETRERLAGIGPAAVLACLCDALLGNYSAALLSSPLYLIGGGLLFSLRFDTRLNLRRELGRHYVGTDPNTAKADKAVARWGLSGRQYAALKLAGLLLCAAALLFLRKP